MPIYQKAFTCQMCGQCCHGDGGIVLNRSDQKRLCHSLNLDPDSFLQIYTKKAQGKVFLLTDSEGYCVFFDRKKGCRIHEFKPAVCLAWPFFKGNLLDKNSWQMAMDYCPGLNPKVSHEEFVRQGLEYLLLKGLLFSENTSDRPNALDFDSVISLYTQFL